MPSNNLMGLILKERFQTVTAMKVYSGKSIDVSINLLSVS